MMSLTELRSYLTGSTDVQNLLKVLAREYHNRNLDLYSGVTTYYSKVIQSDPLVIDYTIIYGYVLFGMEHHSVPPASLLYRLGREFTDDTCCLWLTDDRGQLFAIDAYTLHAGSDKCMLRSTLGKATQASLCCFVLRSNQVP